MLRPGIEPESQADRQVPTLMKATADDERPCPGFLFQEIGKMSQESPGCGQCLLEYLLERLQVDSCHVKLKVLKIFVHLCGHGSQHFLTELRRNSTFIQLAAVYSGPPDPIHGTGLYQKVRSTAQDLASLLFMDTGLAQNCLSPCTPATPNIGMGSQSAHRSGMQGFGYSPGKSASGGDTLLDKIQKAAEVMASAVLPPTEHQGIRLHDNHYRAVVAPSAPIEVAVPACAYNLPIHKPKVTHRCPGQVGGGWEEIDSGHSSSHNSSQENAANYSGASGDESIKSGGTGSQSGASRESGDLSERVEAIQLEDCGQEVALIARLMEGSKVFLSREESQHFLKECATLNCEVVLELLSRRLLDPINMVQMRALCAVACLMTSDLLSLEDILAATQRRLAQLSQEPVGPVANKASKILRQFEALMGGANGTVGRVAAEASNSISSSTPTYPVPLLPTHLPGVNALHQETESTSRPPPKITPTHIHFPLVPHLGQDQEGSLSHDKEEVEEEERTPTPLDESNLVSESNSRTSRPHLSSDVAAGDPEFQPTQPQPDKPCLNRLSLFSGMKLVTERSPNVNPLETERDCIGVDSTEHSAIATATSTDTHPSLDDISKAPTLPPHIPVGDITPRISQSVSAFSFLHL